MPLSKTSDTGKKSSPGLLARLGEKLAATRRAFGGARPIDDALLEELEALLLGADLGLDATRAVLDDLSARARKLADSSALAAALKETLLAVVAPCERPLAIPPAGKPFVILTVGVNGAGKTTTIGKLAHKFQAEGRKVMLAAGDTFRAAAVEQLQAWGERNAAPVIAQAPGADAAAVAHDAMQAARAQGMDVLIIDTAGRLQTQTGLMDELKKIKRVIQRFDAAAPHEVLLVLDAGLGRNALSQFENFHAAVGVTGLCMTKLDGTAKGGMLFALARQAACPIRFIGIGEGIDDLREFNAREFVEAIMPDSDTRGEGRGARGGG
ncbi:MAG: signal recognition particle-docking protein FtsY [Candidatus Muproteobacteria bacterium RBG_16_64_11]|uniref:Signal recognition particle receptor FtsY n=1 Tax=Candidatus Muproteobacteria bacterium RBG_16_64_11 TaxID=1817758 RepID=A0A1F6TB60_9PROT|nr:MAG: signal recognition particle-docking protein FtsY [Candidatus Muproteobacteria bacterium RBG_16_64_11]